MSLFRDSGVVLRTYRLGEADRIIVLLTRDHGKVRAVAKGVRKTSSKFGGRLEPLSHVALLLWRVIALITLAVNNQVEPMTNLRHYLRFCLFNVFNNLGNLLFGPWNAPSNRGFGQ